MPKPRPATRTKSAITTHPCYYFFYGSLCDKNVLGRVLGRKPSEEATLAASYRTAKITGFEIKAWGQYTGLVEGNECEMMGEGKVEGKVYKVDIERDADRLCLYETTAYEVVGVDVEVDGAVVENNVFKYAGNHKLLR